MVEPELKSRIDILEQKIDAVYASVEKTRKYFFWTMIVTFVVFVLPLLGLIAVIPMFLSGLSALEGL